MLGGHIGSEKLNRTSKSSRYRKAIAAVSVATSAVTVAMTAGAGISHASEGGVTGIPAASLSADGRFFEPGPDTIIKMDPNLAKTSDGLKIATSSPSAGPQPAPAGAQAWYEIRNPREVGQSCGTEVIQQVSGRGKTTLVLTVEKKVETVVKKEIAIDAKWISGGFGFDVSRSYTVSNQTRYEVPKGRFGTVQAFPLYRQYQGMAYENGFPTNKQIFVYKPIGVCFNQWTTKAK